MSITRRAFLGTAMIVAAASRALPLSSRAVSATGLARSLGVARRQASRNGWGLPHYAHVTIANGTREEVNQAIACYHATFPELTVPLSLTLQEGAGACIATAHYAEGRRAVFVAAGNCATGGILRLSQGDIEFAA